jgi:hypothetical protein
MATRRPTFKTGVPSITTPRPDPRTGALDQRGIQQSYDNIRERFQNAEAQIAFLQSLAEASVGASELAAMKRQIASLSASVSVLAATLDAGAASASRQAPTYVLLDMSEHVEETIIFRS